MRKRYRYGGAGRNEKAKPKKKTEPQPMGRCELCGDQAPFGMGDSLYLCEPHWRDSQAYREIRDGRAEEVQRVRDHADAE